ncbi:MAG: phage holin family protein [Chthoniobacterales bacterium]|nr:phage holin family protein [Chthoniobacterales bacterium]
MAGEAMRFRNPAGHAGLLNNFVSLTSGLAGFVETRVGLFARESKTALVHLLLLAAGIIGALVMLAFGYVFLLVSIIFGIAHALGISWAWIALGAGILHLLLAGGSAFFAKTQLSKPMFKASMAEMKKDREWLKKVDKKNQSRT